MENKTNKKELSLWIECLTVIALATTLTFINCNKKEDDKTPLFAAAALASRGSGTVATATATELELERQQLMQSVEQSQDLLQLGLCFRTMQETI
ncbi:MAG: hypothetical protein IPH52_25625 [Leptospiraceae bacterium]|nr:hypothetical protein [Leptospiraceae bacterium]